MNLAFKTTFPKEAGTLAGKPTHFVEKIWRGIHNHGLDNRLDEKYFFEKLDENMDSFLMNKKYPNWIGINSQKPKIHTIRHDPNNRWKAGNNIHFWINARTKQQFQFAPVIPCVSTQDIRILYIKDDLDTEISVYIDDNLFFRKSFFLDKSNLYDFQKDQMMQLAQNDGFDTIEDFFQYFNTDYFKGKIIHWTDLKY